jgi:long-chain fatty acid transport protein
VRCGRRSAPAVAVLAAAASLLPPATSALADGYRIVQGGPSIGTAGAGSAASADDPTTAFSNPAGMIRAGTGGVDQVNAVRVETHFRNRGSKLEDGTPLRGGDGGDAGRTAYIPGTFGVLRIGEDAAAGISVTSPFGLGSDYGETWVGRYHATRTSFETLDVAPCAAFRLAPCLTVGAGIDLQYARADLENAVDFGTIAQDRFPDQAAALDLQPQRDDGLAKLKGDSFGLGWNAGLLWQATESTRVGLAFRSAVRHDLEGDAKFRLPPDAQRLQYGHVFTDTNAGAEITLPEVASLGVVHDLDAAWSVLAGVDWTRWSRFESLDVHFDNPNQDPVHEKDDWHDTFRPAAGIVWRPDAKWTFRLGAAWDPSAVSDADRRPRDPDAARFSLACGVTMRLGPKATIDFSYLHAWGKDGPIDVEDRYEGRLTGNTSSDVDYLSVQLTILF